ncbi:MAG TPA: 3-isopropylmalate dehydratase [Burkholderiales bacterium]|jgi:3-isopropylmalate/(R)-2-methylmalate dehydratase small subunit|nr:3-isopropylmalate dehydratase [Burkholderiales bacterium]
MSGRTWKLGDNIDTDVLAPGRYMKFGIEEIATHCLEGVLPEFAATVKPGDVIVAGRNFGAGSSREQAPQALKHLGVAAVLAPSFAGLFYRNALNLGLPVLVCEAAPTIADNIPCSVDFETGLVMAGGAQYHCQAIPGFLLAMLRDGGLLPHLEKKLAAERRPA